MKVAVITGAAQGIGRRTAEILGEHGFAQALIDLREPSETLAALKSRNVDVLSFAGDITSEDVVSEFAGDVESRWGRADVLVNNAGISLIAPSETIAAKDYRRVLEVNLVAPFLLAQAFGRKMLAAGQGSFGNFLRGYQYTDSNGQVAFTTIYPGWYNGRTVHIHIKVRIFDSSGNVTTEATTQLFFADSIHGGLFGQLNVFAHRDAGHVELHGFDLQRRKPRLLVSLTGDATSDYAGTVSIGILEGSIYGG